MKINSIKQLCEAVFRGSWVLTRISENYHSGTVSFVGKTRFFAGFEAQNHFSKSVSRKYANELCRAYFGVNYKEMNAFSY